MGWGWGDGGVSPVRRKLWELTEKMISREEEVGRSLAKGCG